MSSNPLCPEDGFSCNSAVGQVENLIDTRRAVRPAESGHCVVSFATRYVSANFSGFFETQIFHFSPALPETFFI
jgi:hypothetical protein